MELVKRETCLEYYRRRLSEGWKCISLIGYYAVLLSPDGIRRELDLRNDVLTLRPDAVGGHTGLTPLPGGGEANWEDVDEAIPDDYDTFVEGPASATEYDLYGLPNHTTEEGDINSVTVFIYCVALDGYGTEVIQTHAVEEEGTKHSLTTEFASYSHQWPICNYTAQPWTWDEIDALQAGVKLESGVNEGVCTQVYVEVDYTRVPEEYEESAIVYIGVKVSKVRLLEINRAPSVLIGNLVLASRALDITRNASVLIGNLVSATKSWEAVKSASILIGNSVSASRALDITRLSSVLVGIKVAAKGWRGVLESASVLIGNLVSASKSWSKIVASSVLIGVKVSALQILEIIRHLLVLIGNKVTASRAVGIVRISSVLVGNKVSATRLLAITRNSSVLIGNKVTALRTLAIIRLSSVLLGNLVTASGVMAYIRQSLVLVGVKVSAIRLLEIIRESIVSIGVLVTASKFWSAIKSASVIIGVGIFVHYCVWLKELIRVPISRMPLFRRLRSCR